MDNNNEDNLIQQDPVISYDDLVTMVTDFQERLQSLDYRVSNKNFGSKLYQAKETIASKGRFIAGAKDDVVIMDGQNPTYRLWAGAENPADAPFSVDKDGNVVLNSVSLDGYIPDGGALADIGAGNITGTYIANDAITTPKIFANAVTATKILVSQLSAISADIGTVTAGNINGLTITGGLIQTSSTGLRTVLDSADDRIKFMNGGSTYGYIEPYGGGSNLGIVIDSGGLGITINQGTTFNYVDIHAPEVYLNGLVSASDNVGSVASGGGGTLPSGWSASNIATGRYQVTHNLNTTAYSVVVTPVVSVAKVWAIESKSSNNFIVRIANTSFSLENNPFDFVLFKQ